MSVKAHGPDEFGDFHISEEGEQLAKCVVIQNGFRAPAETAAFSAELVNGLNALPALVKALEEIAQRANEYGPGEMRMLDTIHAMHGIARAALASVRGEQ